MRMAAIMPKFYPEYYRDRCEAIFREEFPEIDAEYLIYSDYKEAPDLLRDRQGEFDAILFSGAAAMQYSEKIIRQEIPWLYLPTSGSAIYRALLHAMRKGWDITRLSFDTYDYSMLVEVYQELGYQEKDLHIQCFTGNPQNPDYNERVLAFHQNCLHTGLVCGCITRLNTVANTMDRIGMDRVTAFPTRSTIREQIQFAKKLYIARNNAEGEFAVILVNIGFPTGLSGESNSNYQFVMNRMQICSQVYRYADLIRGAVVEQGIRDLMIFATSDVVQLQGTGNGHISLLDWLSTVSPYPFYIGIGYGKTMSAAQYCASRAIQRSYQERRSCAATLYANESLRVALPTESPTANRLTARTYWLQIAQATGLSVNTISKISAFISQRESDVFTPRELSDHLHISKRSTDRLLEKLELNGYASVIGRELSGAKGRPARRIRLFLTQR